VCVFFKLRAKKKSHEEKYIYISFVISSFTEKKAYGKKRGKYVFIGCELKIHTVQKRSPQKDYEQKRCITKKITIYKKRWIEYKKLIYGRVTNRGFLKTRIIYIYICRYVFFMCSSCLLSLIYLFYIVVNIRGENIIACVNIQ